MPCSFTIRPAAAMLFSYIGYNGTMAAGGDTEDARWDDALKYRLTYGPVHFGAMYKFTDGSAGCFSTSATWTAANCTPEQARNNAYGFDAGGNFGKFFADVVYQHYNQGISVLNPLLGPQSATQPYESTTNSINTNPITGANLIGTNNTLYGIVTDNSAIMFAARYTWDRFRFFAGYEYIRQTNPSNPLGVGALDQGSYNLSGVEDNNLDSPKHVQIWWTGAKYAIDHKTDITVAWYHQLQRRLSCSDGLLARSRFPGFLRGRPQRGVALCGSPYHSAFLDLFAGIAASYVKGGLAVAIPRGPGVPYISTTPMLLRRSVVVSSSEVFMRSHVPGLESALGGWFQKDKIFFLTGLEGVVVPGFALSRRAFGCRYLAPLAVLARQPTI